MAMENTFDETAVETIDLLEARLRRIEYVVCGHDAKATITDNANKGTATQRLSDLEHKLHQLASKSRVVQDLLRLHSKFPDLFQSINPDELPTTLDTASILSIVMASASSYSSTASSLSSAFDVAIPPAELSTQLIDLQPRIAQAEAIQIAQDSEMAELRERSAAVIQKWYTLDVLGTGETWAEMEERIDQVDQRVRRTALARRLDNDMI